MKQPQRGLIAAVILIALADLLGWQWDLPILRQFGPGLPAMNPMTAVIFLFSSFSFAVLAAPRRSQALDGVATALSALVLVVAVLLLAEYFVPVPMRLDQWLWTERATATGGGEFPGRMAFSSAVGFICWSVANLQLRAGGKRRHSIQPLALVMFAIGLLSLIGYGYRVQEIHGILRYLPMAVNTAICFLAAAASFLLATVDLGIMKELSGSAVGSITARRLIPFAFVAPIVLGWLRLYGARNGAFTVEFGASVLVLSIIVCFVAVIVYNARLLNRREAAQKKAQEELREKEQTFGLLMGNIRDYAILMIDRSGRLQSWNPGAQTIYGYTVKEAIGQPISIFYPPEELERNEPAVNLHLAERDGSYRTEGWRMRKNGARFWADIAVTALYDSNRRLQGFAQITRDTSEQKKANDLIRNQARLMEDISDAIITTDRQMRVVSWNKATEKLYGYTIEEARGQDLGELLRNPMDRSMRQAIRELLSERGYWHGEMTYYTRKKVALNVLASVSATRDEQNVITGFVIVCRDITERLRAEQRLIKFNEELSKQVEEKTAEVRDIFERVSDAFMAYDEKGDIVYMNTRATEIMGKVGIGMPGKNIFKSFPVAATSTFGQHFRRAMETQEDQHFEMCSQVLDLWLECHLYPSANGISEFFRDITEEKKIRRQLAESNAELRALASYLQNVREEERAAIAREVHDELGQQLTALNMNVGWVDDQLKEAGFPDLRERMDETVKLLDQAILTVQKIAADLRPGMLDDLGLVEALEWQADEFGKRYGIHTVFQDETTDMEYSSDASIGLFRICQEALTNVARHSGATRVSIILGSDGDQIVLRITDDGKGIGIVQAQGSVIGSAPGDAMEAATARETGMGTGAAQETRGPSLGKEDRRKKLGLLGMKERALMMGGTLELVSDAGKGVTLTVRVPMSVDPGGGDLGRLDDGLDGGRGAGGAADGSGEKP